MKKICCIVSAGPSELYLTENSYIIAADAGVKKLADAKVNADLIIGDFDSLDTPPVGENVIVYPKEKDDTDTLIALKEGIKRGFDVFYISGGVGGLLDHTVANLQTLAYAREKGVDAFLVGDGQCAFVTDPSTPVVFKRREGGRLSVFAVGGDAEGVNISGLKYNTDGITLSSSFPLAVSNAFVNEEAKISLREGKLLIIFEGDPQDIR